MVSLKISIQGVWLSCSWFSSIVVGDFKHWIDSSTFTEVAHLPVEAHVETKTAAHKQESERLLIYLYRGDLTSQLQLTSDLACGRFHRLLTWRTALYTSVRNVRLKTAAAAAARHILINQRFTDCFSHAVLQRETQIIVRVEKLVSKMEWYLFFLSLEMTEKRE